MISVGAGFYICWTLQPQPEEQVLERCVKEACPPAAAALAGVKFSLVSLYPHEKGVFTPFVADWGPALDEETNQSNADLPVFPQHPTNKGRFLENLENKMSRRLLELLGILCKCTASPKEWRWPSRTSEPKDRCHMGLFSAAALPWEMHVLSLPPPLSPRGTCSHPHLCPYPKIHSSPWLSHIPHCGEAATVSFPASPPKRQPPAPMTPPPSTIRSTQPSTLVCSSTWYYVGPKIIKSKAEAYGPVWVITGFVTHAMNSFAPLTIICPKHLTNPATTISGQLGWCKYQDKPKAPFTKCRCTGHLDRCCSCFWL